MNTFNLDQAEVVELKNNEKEEVIGGIAPIVLVGIGLGLIYLSGVAEGILEVYNEKHK